MTNWGEANTHARTQGISPEAQASAARHLSPKQFPKYKPAREEGRAASNWLTSDEGHSWFDQRMSANDEAHGVSTPQGLFSIKDDLEYGIGSPAGGSARHPNPFLHNNLDYRGRED